MRKAFRKRLELLLAVVNELVEGVSLPTRKVGQGNDTLLVCQRRYAERERFQYGATDAQLAAAFSGLLKLTLEWGLVDLPGQKSWKQLGPWQHLEQEEVRAAHGRTGRLVNADRIEPGTFGDEQDVTSFEPVWLFAAR